MKPHFNEFANNRPLAWALAAMVGVALLAACSSDR